MSVPPNDTTPSDAGPGSLEARAEEAAALAAEFLPPGRDGAEYTVVFGHVTSPDVPPYESHYGAGHLFQQTQMLADLGGFYRAFGVRAAPGAERPDHIATELEFLAWLLMREAAAPDREAASVCREARRRFLHDHLARWAPAFTARLLDKTRGEGPYARAAQRLQAFLDRECRDVGLEPGTSSLPLAQFPVWTPDTYGGCPFADSQEAPPCSE